MADMQFRDKSTGWKRYSISCADGGTRILIPHDEDLFMKAFLSNYSIRPSCYSCMFKDTNYYSDLTLGDFWNIGNVMPDYDDDKGVSEIIVRTKKGLKALQQLNGLDMHELSKSDAFQWSLYNSVDMPLERNAFFDFLQNHSLEETDERFMSCNRSKWTLKRIVNGVKRRFGFYKEPPFEIRRPSLEHYFIKERSDFSFDVRRSCTGCSACANACPKDAIRMTPDPEGFLYPSIDASLCVDCHICEKVCPVKNLKDRQEGEIQYFAAKNMDTQERLASSSGGVFSLLARHVLNRGGVVYGARFSDDGKTVVHSPVKDEYGLAQIRGSKYLQSEVGDELFKNIVNELSSGIEVLFSGTPCQIAGLTAFLKHSYENLLLVDVICHGVPSPLVYRKYISELGIRGGYSLETRT